MFESISVDNPKVQNHLWLSLRPLSGLNPGLEPLSFLSPLPVALTVEFTFSILSDKTSQISTTFPSSSSALSPIFLPRCAVRISIIALSISLEHFSQFQRKRALRSAIGSGYADSQSIWWMLLVFLRWAEGVQKRSCSKSFIQIESQSEGRFLVLPSRQSLWKRPIRSYGLDGLGDLESFWTCSSSCLINPACMECSLQESSSTFPPLKNGCRYLQKVLRASLPSCTLFLSLKPAVLISFQN